MRSVEAPAHAATGAADQGDEAAVRFHRSAAGAFETAAARGGEERLEIRVAGRRVALRFAGAALVERIAPALRHLEDDRGAPELTIAVFDSASTATPMPTPPWPERAFRERGEVQGFNTQRCATAYNLGSDALSVFDRELRHAVFWTPDAARLPYYETASPLRTVLSWAFEDGGLQTVHAAGVALRGDGLLLTARGGSGKTTTALLCVEDGFAYAGDNNLLAAGPEEGGAVRCHSLYGSATLRPDNLVRFPGLRPFVRNPERLDAEKALVFLRDRWPDRMTASFRARAVLLPRVTGDTATRLVPASAAACLRALAPSSLFSLPGARHAALARAAALSRALPAWELLLGSDVRAIPRLLRSFLEERTV